MLKILYFFYINLLLCLPQNSILKFSGELNFVSDAPLELIKAKSNKLQGVINLEENTFAFIIPVNSLKGFNSALQSEHFHENYMESNKFPSATYKGKLLDEIKLSTSGVQEVRTKGIFNIHGISKERILKHEIEVVKGKVMIKSAFSVALEDHGIHIPKIVYNKIAEEIKVSLIAEATW